MKKKTAITPRTRSALRSGRSRGPGTSEAVMAPSAQAHLVPDLVHRRLGDRADSLRPGGEDLLDTLGVGHQVRVLLAGLGVVLDAPLRQKLLHVDAAGARRALAFPQRLVVVAECGLEL